MKIKIFACAAAALLIFPTASAAQKKAVDPNSAKDVAELKADAERGDRGAQYELSMVYAYKQDAENALKWLSESAENGYGKAQYTLGNLYYNGSSKIKRDYKKAVQWLEASKKTKYKGSKTDELIASAKLKLAEREKGVFEKKKAPRRTQEKAGLAVKKKAAEAAETAAKTAANAAEKAREAAIQAGESAKSAAEKAALKIERAAAAAADGTERPAAAAGNEMKTFLRKVINKVSGFFSRTENR